MITTVFLDVDNTLLDFDLCARASLDRAFADFGTKTPEGAFQVFKPINDALWAKVDRREMTREELYRTRWDMMFLKLGIGIDGLAFEKRFRYWLDLSAQPVKYSMEMLRYLHGKYTLCAASNAHRSQQEKRLTLAGMDRYLDHFFISETIGHDKPEKAFFDHCFKELGGVQGEECIIIGDSLLADVAGGRNAGMKTCWYNREKLPFTGDEADYIITDLSQLWTKNIL